MPKQKYDWNKIKMEFMLSDEDELKVFIEWKLGTSLNWNIKRITAWWWKEKQERKKKIYLDALKKKQKEATKDIESKMERYEMLWDGILERMENAIFGDWKKNSNDIMNIRKIKRTEMGLPTSISKTENLNKEEKSELTDEELKALNILLNNKWWKNKKQ